MARFPTAADVAARMSSARHFSLRVWQVYRALPRKYQAGIAVFGGLILGLLFSLLFSGGSTTQVETALPTVRVATIASLSGSESTVSVIGSVRSITEAEILAQSGGTVTSVRTKLGSQVPAGFIIAELENAAQRAAVLQAQGSYEAAVAAQEAASPRDVAASARNTYATAYATLDTILQSQIDTFFGDITPYGPDFLIGTSPFSYDYFSRNRQKIDEEMEEWRTELPTADSKDPEKLLTQAEAVVRLTIALANDISVVANKTGSHATEEQLAALASARSGLTQLQSAITAAKLSFAGAHTSATAGASASVKIALGALRGAQAQLEKTLIRAPIGGTINFLPIRVGDYITQFTHVATVAQNGTLEIVAYVSEAAREELMVGMDVVVEDTYHGTITSIAPALDPVTKLIEVHVALTQKTALVNGQSVRVALPSGSVTESGPLLLPLTSLKLTPSARVIFSVGEDGRLIAHEVAIGEVHGDRIEILTPLSNELEIVTDARGFSEGQKVTPAI